ncbi:hypothetical protein V494_04881 [Pseudogymnoascus sp. VKM F-4513 (FW-928)]|nr:hypothetical protein V494_04881 [Pseudogymnoascus sp. VKM F-4513 (FW-928)]
MPAPHHPKQRARRHNPPNHHQASDNDSDMPTHLPPPTRTNTDLNLSVLRRYFPSTRTILSIAANAVVYAFSASTGQWEKSGIEGALFVCETETGFVVVVLNRHGLENLVLDVKEVRDVEVTSEFLILRVPGEGEGEKVMGLWIHGDRDDTREKNAGAEREAAFVADSGLSGCTARHPQTPGVGMGLEAWDDTRSGWGRSGSKLGMPQGKTTCNAKQVAQGYEQANF